MDTVDEYYKNLKTQTNNQLGLYLFCCSISVIWAIYVLFFNSRVIGSIVTFCLNIYLKQYSKRVWIRIRSLSISFISGKIMFSGVHYVTVDYMLYIQDGWITFAYWKPQYINEKKKPKSSSIKEKNKSHSKKTARLNVSFGNFQLHYYNPWKLDETLENLKKNSTQLNNQDESQGRFDFSRNCVNSFINYVSRKFKRESNASNEFRNNADDYSDHDITEDLMQLFSVVNIRIQKGRIFAGNLTLPSILSIRLSNAKMELVTEMSQSKVDEYCLILRGELNKLEVNLIPNKNLQPVDYKNVPIDKKNKKQQVLVLRVVSSDFEYIQDVPSILTFDRRYVQRNDTDFVLNEKEPQWSLVLNCNKDTIMNYGPYFDRQREALWNYFFPPTYIVLEPHPEPTLNERRQTSKFDVTINLKDSNTEINIIFGSLTNTNPLPDELKNDPKYMVMNDEPVKERKLTFRCKSPSQIICSFPWLTKNYGYKTSVHCDFNNVFSLTNMSFKHFLSAENVKIDVNINYPLRWNELQVWNIDLDFSKVTIFFIFYHKIFFQDLVNDWSSRFMADIRKFAPYIYDIRMRANDLEIILPCNQHNWIDVNILENNSFFEVLAAKVNLELKFDFNEFYEEKTDIPLSMKLEDGCARFYVPPTNSNLALLKLLKKNIKYLSIENGLQTNFDSKHWSKFNKKTKDTADNLIKSDAKAETMETGPKNLFKESSSLSKSESRNQKMKSEVKFNKKDLKSENTRSRSHKKNQNTDKSDKSDEFNLLENWFECWQAKSASVVLNYGYYPCPVLNWNDKNIKTVKHYLNENFNIKEIDDKPDEIDLQIEIGPSIIMLYGTFLRDLWFIKEDYLSWDQIYTDMISDIDPSKLDADSKLTRRNVSKTYYDIPYQLVGHDAHDHRNFRPLSVKLRLAIHNINGHLMMDLEENQECLTFPIGFTDRLALELDKVYDETTLQLFVDPVNIFILDSLKRTYDKNICQGHLCLSAVQVRGHAMFSDEMRTKTDTLEYAWLLEILLGDITGSVTPIQTQQIMHALETILVLVLDTEHDLEPVFENRSDPGMPYKYEVVRFSIDLIDLYMIELGTALNINMYPIRLGLCNSHTDEYAKGLSACIDQFQLKLFLNEASRSTEQDKFQFKKSQPVNQNSQKLSKSKTSLYESNTNLGNMNKSIASSNQSILLSSLNSSSLSSIDSFDAQIFATKTVNENLLNSRTKPRLPDSDDFNFWFECFSFSTGTVNFDMALDKGEPEKQMEFLKIHDFKTKRLYFLWQKPTDKSSKHVCGCVGGCSYYSVFDVQFNEPVNGFYLTEEDYFFNMKKSISRSNSTFGRSLFSNDKHILDSHPMMIDKYDIEFYNYKLNSLNESNFFHISKDDISTDSSNQSYKRFNDRKILNPPKINTIKRKSSLNLNAINGSNRALNRDSGTLKRVNSKLSRNKTQSEISLNRQKSLKKNASVLNNNENFLNKLKNQHSKKSDFSSSQSSTSLFSSSGTATINDDDYFTAESSEDNENPSNTQNRYTKNGKQKNLIKTISGSSHGSASRLNNNRFSTNSLKSRNSFVSIIEQEDLTAKVPSKESLLTTTLIDDNSNLDDTKTETNKPLFEQFPTDIDSEMTLKFDIQRPILDSILPKYCYLKYLSRASVSNWNRACVYPYYEDLRNKNINFEYRQKGFDCSYVTTNLFKSSKKERSNDSSDFEKYDRSDRDHAEREDKNISLEKCRINLKFTNEIACYITPLSLTSLERVIKSFKSYKVNPNYLITQMQNKSQASFAQDSIIDVISKTQISMNIPQILVCSLQCGLAEGDKVANAFSNTLASPEEFMSLSLFTICIQSIQTQVIDSQNKSAAIFMIDKIESQFSRLYENETKDKLVFNEPNTSQFDLNSNKSNKSRVIKLSCISNDYSKTSIQCFNEISLKNDRFKNIKNSIMYECAFENISIKAVKWLNGESKIENSSTAFTENTTDQKKSLKELDSLNSKTSIQSQVVEDVQVNEKTSFLLKQKPIKYQVNFKEFEPISTPTSDANVEGDKQDHSRLSLCEFEINKIWFSFPEPPISPKGKRKIPYTRYDWNLLSSVSPAVTSWLCASKHAIKPLKDILDSYNKQVLQIMAALIVGSLRFKESLEQRIDSVYHLNMLSNVDGIIVKKSLINSRHNKQQLNSNDSNLASLRNKKLLNYYLESYLTKNSFGLLNDPNFALVNLARNYLLFYANDFYADLAAINKPDENNLRVSINEVFNTWSTIIISALEKKSSIFKLGPVEKYFKKNQPDSSEDTTDHENQHNLDINEYLFKQNARKSNADMMSDKNQSNNGQITVNLEPKNLVVSLDDQKIVSSTEKIGLLSDIDEKPEESATGQQSKGATIRSTSGNNKQSDLKDPDAIKRTTSAPINNKIQIKNANKMFKPFLNFIGIDAPTGKFYDNLFKEFGSFLTGSLNIKSVDINILGKSTKYREFSFSKRVLVRDLLGTKESINCDTKPSLATNEGTEFRQSDKRFNLNNEKVITTILSFDGLLLNFSIRQIMSECTTKVLTDASATIEQPANIKTHNKRFSMSNPVFGINTMNEISGAEKLKTTKLISRKYHAKIDTNLRINNLTQEVNMPLLRLVHQLYSIIADAIDYDKEQNKLMFNNISIHVDEPLLNDIHETSRNYELNRQSSFYNRNSLTRGSNRYLANKRDCWKYLEEIIENRELASTQRYSEKDELSSSKKAKFMNNIEKNKTTLLSGRDNLVLTVFGRINIKKIKSKAALGTLALYGEMNNVQLSLTFGQKYAGHHSKQLYEGSLNICMDSTFCNLMESDTKQNVVQMRVAKCHLFSYLKKFQLQNNVSSFIHIGQINIDVPLRPMLVHGVVYRESKVIEQNILPEIKNFVIFENDELSNNSMNETIIDEPNMNASTGVKYGPKLSDSNQTLKASGIHMYGAASSTIDELSSYGNNPRSNRSTSSTITGPFSKYDSLKQNSKNTPRAHMVNNSFLNKRSDKYLLVNKDTKIGKSAPTGHVFRIEFNSKLDGFDIRAKLLETPCLKASYLIKNIEINTLITEDASKVTFFLDTHCLSFQCDDEILTNTKKGSNNSSFKRSKMSKEKNMSCTSLSSSRNTTPVSDTNQFQGVLKMNPLDERTNFYLPSISLVVNYSSHQVQMDENSLNFVEGKKSLKSFNYIDIDFKIAPLSRELNAEVIAQLVFVTKVFIKEMNNILQAVYKSNELSEKPFNEAKERQASTAKPVHFQNAHHYYSLKLQVGRISFTGITPTNTALSLYSGNDTILKLTNKNYSAKTSSDNDANQIIEQTTEFTLKPSIEAQCNISVELKTSFKPALTTEIRNYDSEDLSSISSSSKNNSQKSSQKSIHKGRNTENASKERSNGSAKSTKRNSKTDDKEWFQLAYFNTKFDLRNAVKTSDTGFDRESITITVEKPRFYLQPGSIDCAILFWLNYKSTYEYWLQQRQQFSEVFIDQNKEILTPSSAFQNTINPNHSEKILKSPASEINKSVNNFIALKLRVTGLGLALPLSNKIKQDIFKTNTDCLVISLNETSIFACSSGCVVSKGQFSNFCLRFAENFNLNSIEWSPSSQEQPMMANSRSKAIINAWTIPSGSYEVCSSTIEKPKVTDMLKKSPIWILSVKWKMEGIELNLDTAIGKWMSKLADTVTRLADTQNSVENNSFMDQESEIKKLKQDLKFYKETGDDVKIKLIQSRLDVLSLASYAEKGKQIFVKTRNNLKGQLGFNTNHQKNQLTPSKKLRESELFPKNLLLPSLISPSQKKFHPAFSRLASNHSRSKSGDYGALDRKFSQSNDDFNLSYYKHKGLDDNEDQSEKNYKKRAPKLSQQSKTVEDCLVEEVDELRGSVEHLNKLPFQTPEKNSQRTKNIPNTQENNVGLIQQQLTHAPAIDFKLDVKIEINSGKCILHASKAERSNFSGYYGMNDRSKVKMDPTESEFSINTNFIFPAIKVKAFYESSHKKIENRLAKKANLYTMIKIESFVMPSFSSNIMTKEIINSRDMCISPALLDFLEQTLEPFDKIKTSFETASNLTTPNYTSYKTFGQSEKKNSVFTRHNVESRQNSEAKDSKELQKNQDSASYFPVEVVVFVSMLPSSIRFTCQPQSTMECLLKLPTLELVFSTYKIDSQVQEKLYNRLNDDLYVNVEKGMGSLSDFGIDNSIKVVEEGGLSVTCSMTDFSLKFYNRLAMRNNTDSRFFYADQSNFADEKDTLSIKVSYIKVNISRSRKISTKSITNAMFNNQNKTNGSGVFFIEERMTNNEVKLSILADIGSSSFIYDMHNIKEVFIFPKIWYRRSLARRLFFGDETIPTYQNTAPDSGLNKGNISSDSKSSSSNDLNEIKRPTTLSVNVDDNQQVVSKAKYSTLVLFSINLVDFEIKMNIGSVMGNVCLLAKNAKAKSKIFVTNFGKKFMQCNFVLENSRLIAEGGSNGCLLRLQDITSNIEINDKNEETGCPSHKLDFGISATECRIDSAYNQATPILAVRLSSLYLKINDSWESILSSNLNGSLPEALVELNANWDQLHLMITKSTTPDVMLMYYKLIDFFEKQLNEGKDYIKQWEFDLFYEMKVKQQFVEKLETHIKKNFNVNGGNIQLKGNNLTFITFHGQNFKAKKWAVFSLNEPSLDFAAQSFFKTNEVVQQNLGFYLGRNKRQRDMASIYMVYNDSQNIFTRFQTINEWFDYAHGNIDAVGLRDFPQFTTDEQVNVLSQKSKKSKIHDQTKHEEIFHLPSSQILFDTTQEHNTVKFEFKTDFNDHILLTFRTELFGFLHELITSYVAEKDIIKGKEDYIPLSKEDERIYECIKWELEPTLRLISKFGSSVEPPGVDALLRSLGFTHARITIPKWFQRGLLDNLNEIIQQLIKIYSKILADHEGFNDQKEITN